MRVILILLALANVALFALTRLDKVLWPADPKSEVPAYTRRDFVRYLLEGGNLVKEGRAEDMLRDTALLAAYLG